MKEEDLIEQLASLMDDIDLDEIGIKERIKTDIEKIRKLQTGVFGTTPPKTKVADVDIRNYTKYILRDGAILEKRELLSCLRSNILMNNKTVRIA